MAECQLPKLNTRVRFPSPAPRRSKVRFAPAFFCKKCHPLRSLAPPLQTGPAAQPLAAPPPYGCGVPLAGASLGSGLGSGADLETASFLALQSIQKPAEILVFQGLSAGFIFCVPPFDCSKVFMNNQFGGGKCGGSLPPHPSQESIKLRMRSRTPSSAAIFLQFSISCCVLSLSTMVITTSGT